MVMTYREAVLTTGEEETLLEPVEFEEWVARYPQARRLALREAREQVLGRGELLPAEALVKCFLKTETTTSMTDPRNISPRSDHFLSILGPYISAIEHHLHDAPFLVKGINLAQRDERMSPILDFHTYAETDYARFDMTISDVCLELVQDPLLCGYFANSYWIKMALKLARKTKGLSDCGIFYNVIGTRCSGDAHTSIANGLINHFNTWLLFVDVPRDCFISWHEGDDGVVGLTEKYSSLANRLLHLDCLGFKVKLFITRDLNQTTFCGRFLAEGASGLRSYCDPFRTLAKLNITLSMGKLPPLLLAKCLSYSYTDGTTPIIGIIVQTLAKQLKMKGVSEKRAIQHAVKERWMLTQLGIVKPGEALALQMRDVDEELRVPFAIRTGIEPAAQERIEAYYQQVFKHDIPLDFERLIADVDFLYEAGDRLVHISNDALCC
jgi:hypothetical protein